jgi:hypothetical protein
LPEPRQFSHLFPTNVAAGRILHAPSCLRPVGTSVRPYVAAFFYFSPSILFKSARSLEEKETLAVVPLSSRAAPSWPTRELRGHRGDEGQLSPPRRWEKTAARPSDSRPMSPDARTTPANRGPDARTTPANRGLFWAPSAAGHPSPNLTHHASPDGQRSAVTEVEPHWLADGHEPPRSDTTDLRLVSP